jgi:fluoroacetyl-CoA thioesterase
MDACPKRATPPRPKRTTRPEAQFSLREGARRRGYDQRVALQPGLTRTDGFVVQERMLTDLRGSLAVPVLSTPSMIAMMERNAAMLAQEHLAAGQATVGFAVCVKHVASALEGASCSVSADLREVVDGRKLQFDVHVRQGERTIGLGTHERRVIDVDAHALKTHREATP